MRIALRATAADRQHANSMRSERGLALTTSSAEKVRMWHPAADPRCQRIGLPCGAKRTLSKPTLTAAIIVAADEASRSGETYFVAAILEPRQNVYVLRLRSSRPDKCWHQDT
jgi:hypothetical protein